MGYNRDIDELYPEDYITENNETRYSELINTVLLKDEEYHMLEGDCNGYILTSFGRVINIKHYHQCTVYFAKERITTTVRKTKLYFAAEFMNYGWSFNIDTIKRKYDNNKWKYQHKGVNYNIIKK
jgi:hypothetical protein